MLFCCVFVSCNRAIKLHVHDVVLAFGSMNLLTYRGGTALCSRNPTECSTTVQKAPFGKLSASLMSSFLSHLRSSEFQLFGRQYTCKYQFDDVISHVEPTIHCAFLGTTDPRENHIEGYESSLDHAKRQFTGPAGCQRKLER